MAAGLGIGSGVAVAGAPMPRARLVGRAMTRPGAAATLAVLILTVLILLLIPRPLSPDVSGQLWIADRLRHGARLYVDISEINPPLWFWLAVPVDALSAIAQLPAEDGLIVAVGGAALLALLATNRLLRGWPLAARAAFLVYAAAVLLAMPLRDLGQREQLALFGALPYAALAALRRDARPVPIGLAVLVGGGAAAGFALKHYFLAVPVLLEIWLLAGRRRAWRPIRPETGVLVAAALAYAVAVLILTPAYLRVSVPELRLAYAAAGAPDLRHMIRPAQPIWVLAICGIVAERRAAARPLPPFAGALLVTAAGFFLAWLTQHKGWPYQSIATTGCLALALATALLDKVGSRVRPRPIVAAGLVLPVLLFVVPTQWVPTPATDIAPALAGLHAGDRVAIVSKEGRTAWPSTIGHGFRFVGRRGAFWMLAAVDANAGPTGDPRVTAFGRQVVREVARDYRCAPPRRIIFAPRGSAGEPRASADPLGYFKREPRFARLLGQYRPMPLHGDYAAFALTDPVGPDPDDRCIAPDQARLP